MSRSALSAPSSEKAADARGSPRQGLVDAFRLAREIDASFSDRLEIVFEAIRDYYGQEADLADRAIADLETIARGNRAPPVGDPMPPLLLRNLSGRRVELHHFRDFEPSVIVFHNGYWCRHCQSRTHALAEVYRCVSEARGHLLGVTADQSIFMGRHAMDASSRLHILFDPDNACARDVNLAISTGDVPFGAEPVADRIVSQGCSNTDDLVMPATFVVDRGGVVAARFIGHDYRQSRDLNELADAIRAAS